MQRLKRIGRRQGKAVHFEPHGKGLLKAMCAQLGIHPDDLQE